MYNMFTASCSKVLSSVAIAYTLYEGETRLIMLIRNLSTTCNRLSGVMSETVATKRTRDDDTEVPAPKKQLPPRKKVMSVIWSTISFRSHQPTQRS